MTTASHAVGPRFDSGQMYFVFFFGKSIKNAYEILFVKSENKLTKHKKGAKGDSNPRPLAPKARIIPLDH